MLGSYFAAGLKQIYSLQAIQKPNLKLVIIAK